MKTKDFKDLQAGDVVESLPRLGRGPFEIVDVLQGDRYASLMVMSTAGGHYQEILMQPVTLTDATNFAAIRKTKWASILPHSGYKTLNGADPEVFVVDEKDQVIPAWEFLPPKSASDGSPFTPYWDGFQAEFRMSASHCLNSQNDFTCYGLQNVINAARKKNPKAQLSIRNTVEIPMEMLIKAKDEHVALGCAPSLNAYGLQGLDVPNPRLLMHRFAGGHIHKQWQNLTPQRATQIVKAIDALLAVPCVTMFQKLDDPIRRKFYGLPGEYRLPKHGFEYRTLSNAWLAHPAIAQFVRETFRLVTGLAKVQAESVFDYREEEVVSIILNHDVNGAKKLVKRNEKNYTTLLGLCGWSTTPVKKGVSLLQSSITEFVDPLKMEQNWRFKEWQGNSGLPTTYWGAFAEL